MSVYAGNKEFENFGELMKYWDSQRTCRTSIFRWFRYYFWRKWLDLFRDSRLYIIRFYQRGVRGWSMQDCWSFDYYLCNVISEGCKHLENVAHGHPVELTSEKWSEILLEIASGFDEFKKMLDFDVDTSTKGSTKEYVKLCDERKAKFDKSLDLMKIYFGNLWD